MFTIQYEDVNGTHKMQDVDSNSRVRLLQYLATFNRPVVAVYEQASPITKTVQSQLRNMRDLSSHARDFMNRR